MVEILMFTSGWDRDDYIGPRSHPFAALEEALTVIPALQDLFPTMYIGIRDIQTQTYLWEWPSEGGSAGTGG